MLQSPIVSASRTVTILLTLAILLRVGKMQYRTVSSVPNAIRKAFFPRGSIAHVVKLYSKLCYVEMS